MYGKYTIQMDPLLLRRNPCKSAGIKFWMSQICQDVVWGLENLHRWFRLKAGTYWYKSPMKRKEHDLNQTSIGIMEPSRSSDPGWKNDELGPMALDISPMT